MGNYLFLLNKKKIKGPKSFLFINEVNVIVRVWLQAGCSLSTFILMLILY